MPLRPLLRPLVTASLLLAAALTTAPALAQQRGVLPTRSGAPAEPYLYPPGPSTFAEMYTFGRVARVDEKAGYFIVEPPNGLDNLWPSSPEVLANIERMKTENPEAYARLSADHEKLRRDGGVRVWFTVAGLNEMGSSTAEVAVDRWVFVLLGRRKGDLRATALEVYSYGTRDEMVAAHTNGRWDVSALIEDNVFLVHHRVDLPQEGPQVGHRRRSEDARLPGNARGHTPARRARKAQPR